MPRRRVLPALLCLFVSAAGAQASPRERAPGGKDFKRAAAVLVKLRRLEAPAASGGHEGFAKAARKIFPGLFGEVSKLRDGDVKTDLATAAALYESALRTVGEGGSAADCSRELREMYARLCLESAGDRARLLRAKALLHARRAEAVLLYAHGDRSRDTLDAVGLIRAERTTDRAIAEEALYELKELAASAAGGSSATLRGRLEQIDRLLASLPRDPASRLLRESRDALRDGLYWRFESDPALALVVNANSYAAPGVLPRLGLSADDASRAAHANLRAGLKFISRAEEVLGTQNAER